MLHKLQVGQPYAPGKTLAPFTNYNFRGGTHELLLVMDGLTEKEISSVRTGESEFALVVHERIIFLLYRFGDGFKWSDAPYSIWSVPEADRATPEPLATPESRMLLQVVLVDADRNITQAIRAVSLSHEFTEKLNAAIAEQLCEQISIRDYDAAVESAYAQWPSTLAMLAHAIVRCKGGA